VFWLDDTNSATIEQSFTAIRAGILGLDGSQVALEAAQGLLASLTKEWQLLVDGAGNMKSCL
jgi:hypothetical protein